MISCTGVVMAGGQSTRMGRDKAMLKIDGSPLWRIQADKLLAITSETIVSVREAGSLPDCDLVEIPDIVPGLGPLGGLLSCLQATSCSHVLLLGVDMPHMTSMFMVSLMAASATNCGMVPKLDGYYEGLCGVYPVSLLPLLRQVLSGSDRSFRNFLQRAEADGLMVSREVAETERGLFTNWNAPSDLPA